MSTSVDNLSGIGPVDPDLIGNRNYSPPYESPLEDLFALNLDKYLARRAIILKQVEVKTFCGTFRLDFVALRPDGGLIGIECDGEEFHDEARDEWRDAVVLGSTKLQAIYRFPGAMLYYRTEDCLFLLSAWEPNLFSERGHTNLLQLASDTAREAGGKLSYDEVLLIYGPTESKGPFCARIERHTVEPPAGSKSFLKTILQYAHDSGLSDLDQIRARYHEGIGLAEVRANYFRSE